MVGITNILDSSTIHSSMLNKTPLPDFLCDDSIEKIEGGAIPDAECNLDWEFII